MEMNNNTLTQEETNSSQIQIDNAVLLTIINKLKAENTLLKTARKSDEKAVKKEHMSEEDYEEYKRRIALGIKSNGIALATKKESLKSYEEFKSLSDYFISHSKIRDNAMLVLGIATGLRIVDILGLRYYNIVDENDEFLERIKTVERKTDKVQDCLITEAIKEAMKPLLKKKHFGSDFIFQSNRRKPLDKTQAYRIMTEAGKAVNIDRKLGTHFMRKTFATISLCTSGDGASINSNALATLQGLLNHGDIRCTMRYLNLDQLMYDDDRRRVSDFLMGKSKVKDLTKLPFEFKE